jgi:hypothetical protein
VLHPLFAATLQTQDPVVGLQILLVQLQVLHPLFAATLQTQDPVVGLQILLV